MPFTITIEETRTVTKTVGKKWEKVGTKEVDRDPKYFQGSTDEPKTRLESVYGYTPEIDKAVAETRTVLKQEVDSLNVPEVIKAINGL